MAVRHGDIKVIEKALTDYKLKAQEMNVGVNYMALDDERRRQELLLRELREIEEEITSPSLRNSKLPNLASVVGTELSHNSKCLQYLAGISELERSIGDVTTHFTERSVELSDPGSLSKDVVSFKTLSENVKSCWSYVDQLATLAQIHLKASAEYHQFFHEANEIEAKLEKQLTIAQKALKSATERRSHKEATKMATEINEQLNAMRSLWKRSMKLVERSETIIPIRIRMGGVTKGMAIGDPSNRPVMVRALVSLTGPDYKIQKGEILRLMDNRQDSHLWSVRTSTATVEVPGVCLWLMNSDTEAIDRAISIKQKCKKTWLEIINLIRLRLYEVYYDLMEQFNSQEVICSHEEALNLLFDDLQNLLITPVGQDGRLKSNLNTFRQKVIITKRLERLQSGDINLREAEIVQIRSPLMRLHDHIIAADQMQQEMKKLNDHITEYISQVENERRQIESNLDQLNRMNKMSEQQLKDMMRKMDKMRDNIPYAKPTARIKVEPLLEVREELPRQKRSRSQPRMSVLNAMSSSSSSDSETSADHYVRNGVGRRAKSHVGKLDAMVQIGYQNKTAEAQYLNGQTDVRKAYAQSDKSVQLVPIAPLQLSAQTQMGYSVNTRAVQVDASTMEAYNMEVNKNTHSKTMPSSSEDEYILQVVAGGLQTAPAGETKRKHRTRKSPSNIINVHSSTQIGIATNDKALSPVREIDRAQACPLCQRRSLIVSQTQVGPLYSGSERYQDYPLHDVNSEKGPKHLVNKKVQSGYPCLTGRANLYCQCDVLGPERMTEEMETESAIYQNPLSTEQPKKMDTFAQVGVLYSNAQQNAQVPLIDTISSSTQVGMLYENQKRRIGHAQFQQRSSTDLSSASNIIEAVPTDKERYVANVSLKSYGSNSTTQVDVPLMRNSVQAQGMVKEYSDTSVQVGKIRSQNRYAELSVENKLEQIVADRQEAQYASPPKGLPSGKSVQVTREQYDEITQISNLLTHDGVQTREPNLRTHDLQVYDSSILRPKRATSVPSVQYSSETQVGPMVMHESLSPIGDYEETVRATEVLNVQAVPKSTKHKRIQSSCVPLSRNVEMQIGQLFQESATQSMVESQDITHISPTILAVQQKAISLPNLFVAETQVQPSVRGKKLQVSISRDEPTVEKKQKKLQVSVDTIKEMYDVQVATLPIERKEQFDVSCDTQILPPKIAKKVQVSLADLPDIPMVSNAPLVHSMPPMDMNRLKDASSVSDAVCEPMVSTEHYDAQCQCQMLTQTPPPVRAEMVNAGLQISSAPPIAVSEPLKPECRDTGSDPMAFTQACDTFTQSGKVTGVGKKLQVAIEFERPPYEITTQQTYFEDTISIQQPTLMQPVYSAPPQPKVETEDRACEPTSPSMAFDVSVQAAEIAKLTRNIAFKSIQASLPGFDESIQTEKVDKPKTVVLGKKLQVTPAALSFENVQTIFIEPEKITIEQENLVHSAPPIMVPPKVQTDDKECDALEILQAFDAGVQVVISQEKPRPTVAGKKLQVTPEPLAFISSLGDCRQIPVLEIAKIQSSQAPVEPQVVQVQEVTRQYAAIPQRVDTEDKCCDAVEHIDNFDASVQAVEVKKLPQAFDAGVQVVISQEKPRPTVAGKKLQVTPEPLAFISSLGDCRQIPVLEIAKIQSSQAPVEPQVVQVQEVTRQYAAIPQRVDTEDKCCDAVEHIDNFDASVQAVEVKKLPQAFDAGVQVVISQEKPRPTVAGKKLQVTPEPLAFISSLGDCRQIPVLEIAKIQSSQAPVEPQVVQVQEVTRQYAAIPQRVDTEDKCCDAVEHIDNFDASVQAVEAKEIKPMMVGKKLQVSPISLDTANAQTIYEELASNIVQIEQINKQFAAPPSKLEVYDVGIQEKLQLNLRVQKMQTSLPLAKMIDESIDALKHVTSFDVSVQVAGAPKPVIKGKNLQVSSSSFTSVKPQRSDKILQISPVSLENTLVQSTLESVKETVVVTAPKVPTSNKECEAAIKLPSFDVEVQFSEVVPQKVVFDKLIQVPVPLLETTIVQSDFVEEVKIPVAPVEKASVVFAKPPSPTKVLTADSSCEPIRPSETFDAITQSIPLAFAEPVSKPQMFGKKLQVHLVPDLTEKLIQSTIGSKLGVITSQSVTITNGQPRMENEFTQSDFVQQSEKPMMFGKKMQVDLRPNKQDDVAQTEPFAVEAPVIEKAPTIVQPVYSAPPTLNLDIMGIQTPNHTSVLSYVQSSAQEQKSKYHEDGCDPLPISASDAFTQSEKIKQESSTPVVARRIALVQESAPPTKMESREMGCDPMPEVSKFGKGTLVTPSSLEVGLSQTFWKEVELAQVMPKRESTKNETTQSDVVVTYGKKLQVVPLAMEVRVCQTVPPIESSPLISVVEAAPVVEKVCEPMLKTPTGDFSVQTDAPAAKPPSRSVRIQKGVGVFEGTRSIATQSATPEPRRSPLSPALARTIGIEWGVQVEPVRMSGVTQTPPLEIPTIPFSKPSMYSRSTQAELLLEPIKPISELEAFVSAPIPPRHSENLFSFVRETKTKLTGRSRSGSSGLIPYKTQVNQANNLSASVPAMLNIKTDVTSPATITEGWGCSNRTATSQVPRRYANRFRSTFKHGNYDRRNKSLENIYARGSRTLPRHFISDSNLTMENRWLQQQLEMEQRCEECIIQCVRLIGFDRVAQMVMDTRLPGDISLFEDLESYQAKRRRLQNARTQYTSTAQLACPYCYANGRPEWQLGAGEEEFLSGDDRYEWDTMRSYGSSKRGTYKWITRTPMMGHMQVEPTSEEVDQLMKSRALSAYCSDYELQQSGINANFEENAAFTFVAWKTNPEGDEKLEMDTVGHLLKLTMVGARVPGTGEVISAADAFYRGILQVIYMDDERGVILPLPVAINANAVIVEKRFSSGVGIAFQPSRKCPVECTAVWQTPNMRRRTYRVNYIRVSDAERIPVSRALKEGIIDKFSGEIVGVRAPISLEMGNPLLQIRESSVGTGETMERKQRPQRFNIREAILNDIINVDLIQPEIILLPDSEMDSLTPGDGRRDEGGSVGSETNSDLEV